jgi:hypothetical protein
LAKESEMSHTPDPAPAGPTENDVSEAQASPSLQQKPAQAEAKAAQEFYWRRQAEKLEKELAAARTEREVEVNRVARDRDEAAQRAAEAEWRAARLTAVAEAGLSPELQALVPEAAPETVAAYVEKLKPIAEKLARPTPRGLTVTNPPNSAGSEDGRLSRLASEAARGDRRALREYAHLRERVKTIH